jgi:hypothetical protein
LQATSSPSSNTPSAPTKPAIQEQELEDTTTPEPTPSTEVETTGNVNNPEETPGEVTIPTPEEPTDAGEEPETPAPKTSEELSQQ